MAAPAVARHRIEAALADVAAGSTMADAAGKHGVSLATLRRYRNGYAGPTKRQATLPALAPARPAAPSLRARERASDEPPSSPTLAAVEADAEPAAVLALLRTELAHACRRRAAATKAGNDGLDARWSQRIEALAKVVERLEPPPALPPEEVQRQIRAQDGEAIARIEMFLAEPIYVRGLWPDPAKVTALRAAVADVPAAVTLVAEIFPTAPPRPPT